VPQDGSIRVSSAIRDLRIWTELHASEYAMEESASRRQAENAARANLENLSRLIQQTRLNNKK
jgi:hypothetical protein